MRTNLELVREFVGAFEQTEFQSVRDRLAESDRASLEAQLGRFGELHASLVDPDIEVDYTGIDGWDVFVPGGRARGLRAWGDMWRNWFEAWQTNDVEHSEWEADDDWVIVRAQGKLLGRTSGAEAAFSIFQLWRVRDGRIAWYSVHPTREAALAAASRPLGSLRGP